MNYRKFHAIAICILSFFLIYACTKSVTEPPEPKTSGFNSSEEFLENPDVNRAKNNSGIPVYMGQTPPTLAGNYETDGQVVKADPRLQSLQGLPIQSTVCLFNQTSSGEIDFRETIGGIVAWGSGGYVTGEGSQFTIWQESRQSGAEAGLPANCSITVVLIMSGVKKQGGNLETKGLSVVTEVSGCSGNSEELVGVWWLWEATFTLNGACSF